MQHTMDIPLPDSPAKIAPLIRSVWRNIDVLAQPYLAAMYFIDSVDDGHGGMQARVIIAGFLKHAKSWRGTGPNLIKAKLRQIIAQ